MADPPGPEQRQRAPDEALSDPLRARILEALWTRVCSANELVPVVGMPADRLDHRLAELVDAGLVDEYPPHDDTGGGGLPPLVVRSTRIGIDRAAPVRLEEGSNHQALTARASIDGVLGDMTPSRA